MPNAVSRMNPIPTSVLRNRASDVDSTISFIYCSNTRICSSTMESCSRNHLEANVICRGSAAMRSLNRFLFRTPNKWLIQPTVKAYLAKVAWIWFLSCAYCLTSIIRVQARSVLSDSSEDASTPWGKIPVRCK